MLHVCLGDFHSYFHMSGIRGQRKDNKVEVYADSVGKNSLSRYNSGCRRELSF